MNSAYTQLLSVGLVWMSFHCAGMCGPLVIGLDVAGVAQGLPASRGVLRIATYQLGRMTTLMALGALAGLVGRGLTQVIEPAGAVFALLFGLVVAATLGVKLVRGAVRARAARRTKSALVADRDNNDIPAWTRVRPGPTRLELGRPRRRWSLSALLRPLSLTTSFSGTWLLGVLMGFLPCMIVIWALGLAATTASPLDGAFVMMLLVAMTTPVLLGVTLLPRALPRRARRVLPYVLMAISATWLIAVGLAGLGVMPHRHIAVGELTIMLW